MTKPVKLINSYVYVVLEYGNDPTVHGVFVNEDEAKAKRAVLLEGTFKDGKQKKPPQTTNYVSVLKKPVQGKGVEIKKGNYYEQNKQLMAVYGEGLRAGYDLGSEMHKGRK